MKGNMLTWLRLFLVGVLVAAGMTVLPVMGFSQEKVTLNWWTWHGTDQMNNEIREAFEKKYPNISVKYTKYYYADYLVALKNAFATGTAPDVMGLEEGFMPRLYRGSLDALDNYAEESWGPDWEKEFVSSALEYARLGDPKGELIYSFPISIQALEIWYNSSLFDKAGVTEPQTYDELKDIAKKLRTAGIVPYILGAADDWLTFDVLLQIIDQTAPDLFNQAEMGEASYTEPGFAEALHILIDMKDNVWQKGALAMSQYPEADSIFWAGGAAMYPTGSWSFEGMSYGSDEVARAAGIFPFPALKKGGRPTRGVGGIDMALGIFNESTHKEETWKFIKFFAAEEGIEIYYGKYGNEPPAKIGVTMNPDSPYQKYESQRTIAAKIREMVKNINLRRHFVYPELREVIITGMVKALIGQMTPEEVFAKTEKIAGSLKR